MKRVAKGFSLIELLAVLAIIGVLMAIGMPALTTYSRNVKLRATAESFLAALQLARGEAIALNNNVEIILTNSSPTPDGGAVDGDYPPVKESYANNLGTTVETGKLAANAPVAHASTASDPSYNWLVRTLPGAAGVCGANPAGASQQAQACWFIAGRRGAEGAGGSGADSGSQILIEGPAALSFTSLGTASTATNYDFSSPAGGACASLGGPIRCLRVRVELGGRAKMCDPAATSTGDTRGC